MAHQPGTPGDMSDPKEAAKRQYKEAKALLGQGQPAAALALLEPLAASFTKNAQIAALLTEARKAAAAPGAPAPKRQLSLKAFAKPAGTPPPAPAFAPVVTVVGGGTVADFHSSLAQTMSPEDGVRGPLREIGKTRSQELFESIEQTYAGDPFEIEQQIGEGGLGLILRAKDRRSGRIVAIKQSKSQDTESNDQLFEEASKAARITHPNSLTNHEIRRNADGTISIVMPLVEGDLIKDGKTDIRLNNLKKIRTYPQIT